jgi:hypothetical protein
LPSHKSGAGFPQLAQASPTAAAQTSGVPADSKDSKSEYDAAFQAMLRHPADLDVLFRFATIASRTGDLEGAISALERMLNPDLPRVRLELGVLYYRLAWPTHDAGVSRAAGR